MIFSGNNYLSLSDQTGLSFSLDISINNLTGNCNLGFTGQNKNLNFKFDQGRVFDPENRLVHFYDQNKNINISGNIFPNNYSYSINNSLLCSNGLKNPFLISGYYINNNNCTPESTINILGTRPDYKLNLSPIFYITGTNYITGSINNYNNLNFEIYSGSINTPAGFLIKNLSKNILNTGFFEIDHYSRSKSQNEDERQYLIELNLFTNFGKITEFFYSTGSYSGNFNINLLLTSLSGANDENNYNGLIGTYKDIDYLLDYNIIYSSIKSAETFLDKNLNITLEYFGGKTGQITGDIVASGYKNLNLTGILNGSGYLNQKTSLNATGYHALSGIEITGYISGNLEKFITLTGNFIMSTGQLLSTGYYANNQFIDYKKYNFTGFAFDGVVNYNNIIMNNFEHKLQTINQVVTNDISVNQSGSILLLSSSKETINDNTTGALYIFTGNGANWNLACKYVGKNHENFFATKSVIDNAGTNILTSSVSEESGIVYLITGDHQNIIGDEKKIIFSYKDSFTGSGDFGNSLSINNDLDTLLIGAPNYNSAIGYVDVYYKPNAAYPTWYQKTITGDLLLTGHQFGYCSSISKNGNIILIGAPGTGASNNSGYAYIFSGNRTPITQDPLDIKCEKLSRLQGSKNSTSFFGKSVSLNESGTIAAIGTPNFNSAHGGVYIFTGNQSSWAESYFISGEVNEASYFGNDIKLNKNGNLLAISAPNENSKKGAAYIYTGNQNGWTNIRKITEENWGGSTYTLASGLTFINENNFNALFLNNILNNDLHILSDINFSGYIGSTNATGLVSITDNYLITGLITGQTYTKTFLDAFNVITGYYINGLPTGLIDFRSGNNIKNNFYYNSGFVPSNISDFFIRVKTKNYFNNQDDITGVLTLSGTTVDNLKQNTISIKINHG
jgi:hypothetical protein